FINNIEVIGAGIARTMLLTTIGFILACITSAFVAVMLAQGQPDKVPIVLIPILIAVFPLLAARTRIARYAAGLSGLVLARVLDNRGFLNRDVLFPRLCGYIGSSGVPNPHTRPAPTLAARGRSHRNPEPTGGTDWRNRL